MSSLHSQSYNAQCTSQDKPVVDSLSLIVLQDPTMLKEYLRHDHHPQESKMTAVRVFMFQNLHSWFMQRKVVSTFDARCCGLKLLVKVWQIMVALLNKENLRVLTSMIRERITLAMIFLLGYGSRQQVLVPSCMIT